ncbi:MAG TPA: hypothetical protein VF796_29010 [Humisphaera sp.]
MTPRARAFIAEHVESVMQLELLLLLSADPSRGRTVPELAGEMRVDPGWVEVQLRSMAARRLLSAEPAGATAAAAYRFAPQTDDLRRAVAEVAAAYADRRVTVISLIFAKPIDSLRSFADAFRIRREPSDG